MDGYITRWTSEFNRWIEQIEPYNDREFSSLSSSRSSRDSDRDYTGRCTEHCWNSQPADCRLVRALCQIEAFPLASLRPAFPRLSLAVRRAGERLRKIGGTTIRSIGHIASLQTIDDDDEVEIPAAKMLNRLLEDNEKIADAQRAAIDICEDHNDSVTSNLLQEILDGTERRIWFLHEAAQRG
jgi:Ferritin-like domain